MNDAPPIRRGPLRPQDVPADHLVLLSQGAIDTVNFAEQFAIDIDELIAACAPELRVVTRLSQLPLKRRLAGAAGLVASEMSPSAALSWSRGQCDTIRAIASLAVSARASLTPCERLEQLRPYAADPHFGVREWAWIGLRDELRSDVIELLPELTLWAQEEDPNLRRFASEITRPRGVWTPHLPELRDDPEIAVDLINLLSRDSSRYVRLSVGNWLNDASKDNPSWVRALAKRWRGAHGVCLETSHILSRGLRTADRRSRAAGAP